MILLGARVGWVMQLIFTFVVPKWYFYHQTPIRALALLGPRKCVLWGEISLRPHEGISILDYDSFSEIFRILLYNDTIPRGWRIATIHDIKEHNTSMMVTLAAADENTNLGLADGVVKYTSLASLIEINSTSSWMFQLVISGMASSNWSIVYTVPSP